MDEKERYEGSSPGSDREIVASGSTTDPEQPGGVPAGPGDTAVPTEAAGSEEARQPGEAQPPVQPSEAVLVHRVLTDILRLVGFRARIEFAKTPDGYHADIRSRQATGILIGHRGNTLRALQYLVRTIVRRAYPEVPPVTVDVGGYRVRRENFLKKKATAVARIVLETRREMALDLLTEKEMELVRDALRVEPGVRVYALGTGTRRNVIIAPVPDQGE